MKSLIIVIVAILFITTPLYSGINEVLMSLEKLKGASQYDVTKDKFSELIAEAAFSINLASKDSNIDKKFIEAAKTCKVKYEIAFQALMIRNEAIFSKNIDTANEANLLRQKSLKSAEDLLNEAYKYVK